MTRKQIALLAVVLAASAGMFLSYAMAQPAQPAGPPGPGSSASPGPSAPGGMPPGPVPGMPGGPGGMMPPGSPGAMPGMVPGGPAQRPEMMQRMERMGAAMGVVDRMGEICFNPRLAGMLAVGMLKDEVRRKPADVIKEFEEQLGKTKSLGLRNAIRMSLKDLYKAQGEDEKVLDQARAMLAENDQAIGAEQSKENKAKD